MSTSFLLVCFLSIRALMSQCVPFPKSRMRKFTQINLKNKIDYALFGIWLTQNQNFNRIPYQKSCKTDRQSWLTDFACLEACGRLCTYYSLHQLCWLSLERMWLLCWWEQENRFSCEVFGLRNHNFKRQPWRVESNKRWEILFIRIQDFSRSCCAWWRRSKLWNWNICYLLKSL